MRAFGQHRVDGDPDSVGEAAEDLTGGIEEETSDAELAYARFPRSEPTRYRDGWLPSG